MKKIIVLLHGWSSTMTNKRYSSLKELLEKQGFTVYIPDLPGFGENSTIEKESLEFEDYISFVRKYIEDILKKTKQKQVILIGHSFGGRVAIRFTSMYSQLVAKLILTGASGIPRPLPSIKKKLIFTATKALRPLFIIPPFSFGFKFFRKMVYYSIGEMDYYKAGKLTQTFKNVYKVSIKDDLEKISVPTLLIWGENDQTIPLQDAQFMNENIKHSQLIVIPHATHKLPYEMPVEFTNEIIKFV